MTGLVLSGGAARSIAHLGMLKVLDENGIKINKISGVSGGAVIGAFYSYGFSPDEIMEMILDMPLKLFFKPAFSSKGLISMEGFEKEIEKNLPARSFEDLKIPLIVSASHIYEGKTIFFSEGELIQPLLASCCLPAIFAPVKIEGALFIDGGLINNLPAEPLVEDCDFIVGLHSNPISHHFEAKNYRYIIERAFLLAINENAQNRKALCDIFWEPVDLGDIRISSIEKAKVIFNIGYKYGKEHVDKLLKKLEEATN